MWSSASTYEPNPKPAMTPVATAEITLVWRNSSRACGFEMCTSMSVTPALVTRAAASRSAYE